MLILIPIREAHRNEELRYAVRAWQEFHPESDIVIIGGKPDWWKGIHLKTIQRSGPNYQWSMNFPHALEAAIKYTDGGFWWSADDIFPLQKLPNEILTYCRMTDLDRYIQRWDRIRPSGYTGMFVDGMRGQRNILRAQGINTQHNADLHLPHWLESKRLDELMTLLREDYPKHPRGHFRAIYGGFWPGNVVRVHDPKVAYMTQVDVDKGWVSTHQGSWRSVAGKWLRSRFKHPSKYEKPHR